MAVGDAGNLITTADGGLTWETIDTGISNTLNSVSVTGDSCAVAAGAGGTILRMDALIIVVERSSVPVNQMMGIRIQLQWMHLRKGSARMVPINCPEMSMSGLLIGMI